MAITVDLSQFSALNSVKLKNFNADQATVDAWLSQVDPSITSLDLTGNSYVSPAALSAIQAIGPSKLSLDAPMPVGIQEILSNTIEGDTHWNNVSFLFTGKGLQGAAPSLDSTGKSLSTSTTGVVYTQQDGFQCLDVTQGVILSPYNNAFDFGTGDFTAELDAYFSGSLPADYRFIVSAAFASGTYAFGSYFSGSRTLAMLQTAVSWRNTAQWTPVFNGWTHLAWSRISGQTRIFADGQLLGTFSDTVNWTLSGTDLRIGVHGSGLTKFLIKNVRLTKGVGRYSASFTPPTELPTSANARKESKISLVNLTSQLTNPDDHHATNLTIYGNPTAVDSEVSGNNAIAQAVNWRDTDAIVDISAQAPGTTLQFRVLAEAGGAQVWGGAVEYIAPFPWQSETLHWFDGLDLSTMTLNISDISQLNDKVTSVTLAPSHSSKSPTYVDGQGIYFDGGDDLIFSAPSDYLGAVWFVVFARMDSAGMIWGVVNNNPMMFWYNNSTNTSSSVGVDHYVNGQNVGITESGLLNAMTGSTPVVMHHDPITDDTYSNKSVAFSATFTSLQGRITGYLREAICIRNPSQSDVNSTLQYLYDRHGITGILT